MHGDRRTGEVRSAVGAVVLNTVGTREGGFLRTNGVLHADAVPLRAIAAAVGTPCYVYSANVIRSRYQMLAEAFDGVEHRIHYAMKANSSLSILRLLHGLGAGVDIVSGGELHRAQRAGIPGGAVVFSGVGKTAGEIAQALDAGIALINVESEAELLAINTIAAQRGTVASVALRINPEVTVASPHEYIKTGEKGQKFGIPRDAIAHVGALISDLPHVALRGMGMHLGSQIVNAEPMREALPRLLDAVAMMRTQGHQLVSLDVGGGLAVPYAPGDASADLTDYAQLIRDAVRASGLRLMLEPGRFLVAEAGVLLTEVLYRKHAAGKDIVVTDAAMNDLLRPALYGAHHEIEAVDDTAGAIVADVVGPVCESGDFFAKGRPMADVQAGALLAVRTAGAYGFAMASNYNSRPRAAEVLVDSDRFAVITEREAIDDLTRRECVDLQWRTN